jgi:hypothetical protein
VDILRRNTVGATVQPLARWVWHHSGPSLFAFQMSHSADSWRAALAIALTLTCGMAGAASAQPPGAIPAPIDTAAVLDAVYGEPREARWLWTVPADAPAEDGQDLRGHEVEVRALMSAHFVQDGHERFLVVTGMIDPRNDCHGCETLIGAALYTLDVQNGMWHPGPVAAALALAGTFGVPPEVSFQQLGPEVYGFGMTQTWTGTGETDNWLTLWGPQQDRFVQILSVNRLLTIELSLQTPASDCQIVRHDIHVMPDVRNGLFDLAAHISTGRLHTDSDSADACELPLSTAADYRQLMTVFHYDAAAGRYCQEAALPGVGPEAPLCEH